MITISFSYSCSFLKMHNIILVMPLSSCFVFSGDFIENQTILCICMTVLMTSNLFLFLLQVQQHTWFLIWPYFNKVKYSDIWKSILCMHMKFKIVSKEINIILHAHFIPWKFQNMCECTGLKWKFLTWTCEAPKGCKKSRLYPTC